MSYRIIEGLRPPIMRPPHRTKLDDLIALAASMKSGEAAVLTESEAQTFRVILNAQGFDCATDGWRCDERGKTLIFKLPRTT